ncbi:MAG: DUF58 domain-containing protein [Spirochaetaceae bacterium]|nr:DUF58 domain-containing protein [Spirochaetaceae bacterium]
MRFFRSLTASGFFALAAGLGILVRGLAYRDPYEVVLAGAALLVWTALFLAGVFGCRRLSPVQPGWAPPVPLAAGGGEPHTVTGLGGKTPWFFRLHFTLRGSFFPAEGRRFRVSAELAGGAEAAHLELNFPLSGIFHGQGFCRLRDVFGFFAFPCGPALRRSLPVRSSPFAANPPLRIDPFSGAEDRQSRSQTDEERYYMREYTPGDRFRDINWKSSERLATLITRISPHTREKTRQVYIALRNYGPAVGAPLLCVWLLDRIKARLARFLRSAKEQHPEFIFHISTATDSRVVQTEEEVSAFLDDLARMGFRPAENREPGSSPGRENAELYLFSTSCDTGLPALLASRGASPSHLYISFPARRKRNRKGDAARRDAEVFRAGALFAEGFLPVAGFIARRQVPGLEAVPAPQRGSLEVTYAEVRL